MIGLNLEMNSLRMVVMEVEKYQWLDGFLNLQYLNLSHNLIFLTTICHILQYISAPLTHLIINNCGITSGDELHEIANFSSVQKLIHLEIAGNSLHISGALMKLFVKCHRTLSFLSLKRNRLGDACVRYVIVLLRPPFMLKTLLIGQNCLSLDSVRTLHRNDEEGRIKDLEIGSFRKDIKT